MYSTILKEIREFVPFVKDHKLKSFWTSQLNLLKDKQIDNEGVCSTQHKQKKVRFNKEDTHHSNNNYMKSEKKKSLSCSHVYNPNDINNKNENDTTRSITPNPQFINYNTSFSFYPQPFSYSNYVIPNNQAGYYSCNYYPIPNYQQIYNTPAAYPYQYHEGLHKGGFMGSSQSHSKPSVDLNSTITCSDKGNSYSSLTQLTPTKASSSKSKLLGLVNKDLEIEI
jgi:hypothetical protein